MLANASKFYLPCFLLPNLNSFSLTPFKIKLVAHPGFETLRLLALTTLFLYPKLSLLLKAINSLAL